MSNYEALKAAGHSPAKAAEICLDAERGDVRAIQWIKTVRAAYFADHRKPRRPDTVDDDRALEINGKLVMAYMHQQGITDDDVPNLDDVTPAEAIEAARIAADLPGQKQPDGTTLVHMRFEQTESVVRSYAYAVFHTPRPARLAAEPAAAS
jgi:hypothetical protein